MIAVPQMEADESRRREVASCGCQPATQRARSFIAASLHNLQQRVAAVPTSSESCAEVAAAPHEHAHAHVHEACRQAELGLVGGSCLAGSGAVPNIRLLLSGAVAHFSSSSCPYAIAMVTRARCRAI